MGIQHWGAFGGFQKKTGPLVGHWTNGQNVITALPHPSQVPATESQTNQRSRFGIMVSFVRQMNSLLKPGFKNAKKEKESSFNAALRENFPAISNVFPFTINYSKIVYSKGTLERVYLGSAATNAGGLKFEWEMQPLPAGSTAGTDKASFMVYDPNLDLFVIAQSTVARSVLSYDMLLPADFSGNMVSCWMSFEAADGKNVSDSIYLGAVPAG